MTNFVQILIQHQVRVTKHKLKILELFNYHRHLQAIQIYELLAPTIKISLATIYRTLSIFATHKILQKHNFNDDVAVYELLGENDHHDHMFCIKCKTVIEFINPQIEELQQQIVKEQQFLLISHSMVLYGICIKCND